MYLEDYSRGQRRPLLPSPTDPLAPAHALEVDMFLISETQSLMDSHVLSRVADKGGDRNVWTSTWLRRGLESYEQLCAKTAGRFSVGDEITLADVCLLPVVWNVEPPVMLLKNLPTIKKVFYELQELPEVKAAHPREQPDAPKMSKYQAT